MTVLRSARELLDVAKDLSSWIKGTKDDSHRLECMKGLGVYATTVTVESTFSKWAMKIGPRSRQFPLDQVYDIKVYSLKPVPGRLDHIITRDASNLSIDFTKITGLDMFRLEVYYRMETEWLDALVHHRSSPEPLKEAMRYNLSAQLKEPASLAIGFREVDVEEFPVEARVHIQEDIDTSFPLLKTYKRMREIENELFADYDPHTVTKTIGLKRERYRLKKKLELEDPAKVLRDLLMLVRPLRFLDYLRTEEDFRLHDCHWGTEFFEMLGIGSLPKSMDVTARTDLSLTKPASHGFLTYDSGKFSSDVRALMEKRKTND